ncbi:tyrosine-protein phosphatase [Streptomyces sp. enrichment culture]|uniref:tyrosine-protein phosphatase n=1 Tax=Streptomyces sp. enrichment culture TaxID=1795815 RepID=UPI003F569355
MRRAAREVGGAPQDRARAVTQGGRAWTDAYPSTPRTTSAAWAAGRRPPRPPRPPPPLRLPGQAEHGHGGLDAHPLPGIRTVVDLRHPWETAARGRGPEHPSFAYHNLSSEHRPYGQAALAADVAPGPYLAERYTEVAEDGAKEIAAALRLVADAARAGAPPGLPLRLGRGPHGPAGRPGPGPAGRHPRDGRRGLRPLRPGRPGPPGRVDGPRRRPRPGLAGLRPCPGGGDGAVPHRPGGTPRLPRGGAYVAHVLGADAQDVPDTLRARLPAPA